MELTKEYFDNIIKSVATKADIEAQTKELKAFAGEQTADLARIIATTVAEPMEQHFAELKDYLEVRGDVQALKADMQRIKAALHIS